jgi:hypothetical protein
MEAAVAWSKYYPGIFLEGLMKTTKSLSQESQLPGRGSNCGPHEYNLFDV